MPAFLRVVALFLVLLGVLIALSAFSSRAADIRELGQTGYLGVSVAIAGIGVFHVLLSVGIVLARSWARVMTIVLFLYMPILAVFLSGRDGSQVPLGIAIAVVALVTWCMTVDASVVRYFAESRSQPMAVPGKGAAQSDSKKAT